MIPKRNSRIWSPIQIPNTIQLKKEKISCVLFKWHTFSLHFPKTTKLPIVTINKTTRKYSQYKLFATLLSWPVESLHCCPLVAASGHIVRGPNNGETDIYYLFYLASLHYTVLYCTVLYCAVLYCTVLCWNAPHCTLLYCNVLHCIVLYLTTLHGVHPIFIGHRLFAKQENKIVALNITLDISYNIITRYLISPC